MSGKGWEYWVATVPTSFEDYEEHPRYGRGPRYTQAGFSGKGGHWRIAFDPQHLTFVPGTAVEADPTKHRGISLTITHYVDELRQCGCGQKFIFFAEEQKHWYEELGFNVSADCNECLACRKSRQAGEGLMQHYQELLKIPERTLDQDLELAELGALLIELGLAGERVADKIRMILNRMPEDVRDSDACRAIRLRLAKSGNGSKA